MLSCLGRDNAQCHDTLVIRLQLNVTHRLNYSEKKSYVGRQVIPLLLESRELMLDEFDADEKMIRLKVSTM